MHKRNLYRDLQFPQRQSLILSSPQYTRKYMTLSGYRGGYKMITLHFTFSLTYLVGRYFYHLQYNVFWISLIFLNASRYRKYICFRIDSSFVRSLLSKGLWEGFVMVVCSVRYILPFINGIEATCPFTPEVDKDSEEDMVEFHNDATNDEDRIPLITDIL